MGTNNHIARLKLRLDQAITQRDHWKQLAENRNSIVVTEVCPESRSVEEYIIDADSVRASWRLIRGYREQIEALRAALLGIASVNPAERGIEWAKSYASDGLKGAGSDLYARWLDTFKEAEALRAENARLRQQRDKLAGLLRDARELIDHGDFSEGHCMCGSSVDGHGLGDGHSPVDAGEYYAGQLRERIDAALSELTT